MREIDRMTARNLALVAGAALACAAMASKRQPEPTPTPTGPKFHEALSFEELGVTIGVRHVAGVGYRVVIRTPEGERHLSVAAARRLAGDYAEDTGVASDLLAKVAAGLRATADQLEIILTRPAEGNA